MGMPWLPESITLVNNRENKTKSNIGNCKWYLVNHVFIMVKFQRNSSVHYYPGSTNILQERKGRERGTGAERRKKGREWRSRGKGWEGKWNANVTLVTWPRFPSDSYVRKSSVFSQVLLSEFVPVGLAEEQSLTHLAPHPQSCWHRSTKGTACKVSTQNPVGTASRLTFPRGSKKTLVSVADLITSVLNRASL